MLCKHLFEPKCLIKKVTLKYADIKHSLYTVRFKRSQAKAIITKKKEGGYLFLFIYSK